jgi:hypothetical protein
MLSAGRETLEERMITERDVGLIAERGRHLPPAEGFYIENDFVTNLIATVLDYQLHTTAVERALGHYKERRWDQIRDLDDLKAVFEMFDDSQEGNRQLAQHLWEYDLWTRAEQLRRLTEFFESIGITNQTALKAWAETSTFERDFQGRVRGLGPAVYQWLIMRQGVETVKPDVHVRRFAEVAIGRPLSDNELIVGVERAARVLGLTPLEFDWRIWEWSREQPIEEPNTPRPKAKKPRIEEFVCDSCFATKPESLRSVTSPSLCIDCA